MKWFKILLSLTLILAAGLATTGYVLATPSNDFHEISDEIFDEWGICRTRASGEDGFYQISRTSFRPVIAFESLGEEAAFAYNLGGQFATEYSDRLKRAEAVFNFVRDRVRYTSDIDQFEREEFAVNADELAMAIDQNGVGYGDCEDSSVLLAVMYKGAGFRSAIAVGSEHTASLVYLPEYKKASAVFEIDGESGWVWAEATGNKNYLGWVHKQFIDVDLAVYEIGEETITSSKPSAAPSVSVARAGKTSSTSPFPFATIFVFLWLLPLFRRRRVR